VNFASRGTYEIQLNEKPHLVPLLEYKKRFILRKVLK
jgi:hypothetical protein